MGFTSSVPCRVPPAQLLATIAPFWPEWLVPGAECFCIDEDDDCGWVCDEESEFVGKVIIEVGEHGAKITVVVGGLWMTKITELFRTQEEAQAECDRRNGLTGAE